MGVQGVVWVVSVKGVCVGFIDGFGFIEGFGLGIIEGFGLGFIEGFGLGVIEGFGLGIIEGLNWGQGWGGNGVMCVGIELFHMVSLDCGDFVCRCEWVCKCFVVCLIDRHVAAAAIYFTWHWCFLTP